MHLWDWRPSSLSCFCTIAQRDEGKIQSCYEQWSISLISQVMQLFFLRAGQWRCFSERQELTVPGNRNKQVHSVQTTLPHKPSYSYVWIVCIITVIKWTINKSQNWHQKSCGSTKYCSQHWTIKLLESYFLLMPGGRQLWQNQDHVFFGTERLD